jgi:hypothetical protein
LLTPKFSFACLSAVKSTNKRDSSAVIEQTEANGSKRPKNYYISDFLRIGKDGTSSILLPRDLRREIPDQVINLRPRKTQETVPSLLDF